VYRKQDDGSIAVHDDRVTGELDDLDALRANSPKWHSAVDDGVRRNCVFADMVRGYGPDDWDTVFGLVDDIKGEEGFTPRQAVYAGATGAKLFGEYAWRKFRYRNGGYAQIREDEYAV
jgi:electron-transferring-flavoprotein dehydrogenase